MQYLSDMSHCMTPYFRDDNVDIVWDIVYFALLKTAREMSAYNNFQKNSLFYCDGSLLRPVFIYKIQ